MNTSVDVVFFEFCLHEVKDPGAALERAFEMAEEILIIDHAPESQWAWFTAETEKATVSWEAVRGLSIVGERTYHAVQKFSDHRELHDRIKVLGEPSVSRILQYEGEQNIRIEMDYSMALIHNSDKPVHAVDN